VQLNIQLASATVVLGQVRAKPPRKLGILGFQRMIFKPFHASIKCNN